MVCSAHTKQKTPVICDVILQRPVCTVAVRGAAKLQQKAEVTCDFTANRPGTSQRVLKTSA
jgi:hypothetical protein